MVMSISTNSFCQEKQNSKRHVVFAEFAGAIVAGVGLGYERYLPIQASIRSALRAGVGRVENFATTTTFFGGGFIYGKKSSLEIGLNYLINYDATVFDSDDEPGLKNDPQLLVGYRYQNWNNGIIFRAFYIPPVGCCATSIPVYSGLSFGFAF